MTIFNKAAFKKLVPKEIDLQNFGGKDVVELMRLAYRNFLTKPAIVSNIKKFSSFVYKHSFDPSLMMIFFNSFGIISSHLSQINGLRKSKRENKEYLIDQEKKELLLDSLLTVIPPFIIKRIIGKKFDSGKWAVDSQLQLMATEVASATGTTKEDFFAVMPTTFKQDIKNLIRKTKIKMKDSIYFTEEFREKIEIPKIPINDKIPAQKNGEIFMNFDNLVKGRSTKLRNGLAYDEFTGCKSGITTIATLGYTIIAMSIIMPIIKNILSNKTYKKELAKIGETPESIRRKKRFAYNENPVYNTNSGLFASMSQKSPNAKNNIYKQNLNVISNSTQCMQKSSVFADFNKTASTSLKV